MTLWFISENKKKNFARFFAHKPDEMMSVYDPIMIRMEKQNKLLVILIEGDNSNDDDGVNKHGW